MVSVIYVYAIKDDNLNAQDEPIAPRPNRVPSRRFCLPPEIDKEDVKFHPRMDKNQLSAVRSILHPRHV